MYHIFFHTIFKDFKYHSNVSRKIHYIVNFKFVSASVDSLKQLATTILHDMRHSQVQISEISYYLKLHFQIPVYRILHAKNKQVQHFS